MTGPITVWLDYHSEGWQPNDFEDEASALDFIKEGTSQPFRITCELKLGAWIPAKVEKS